MVLSRLHAVAILVKPPHPQLAMDYRAETGAELPWRTLGFPSLSGLLRALPPSACRLEPGPRGLLAVGPAGRRALTPARQPGRRPRQQSMAWVPPAPRLAR
jgi:hypothetical protein